jgi:hypothetical protein
MLRAESVKRRPFNFALVTVRKQWSSAALSTPASPLFLSLMLLLLYVVEIMRSEVLWGPGD